MMRKVLIGFGVLVVLLGCAFAYLTLVLNKRSPEETVSKNGVTVKYCRPYKKERVIFGGDGALVPNDKYWRLGANAATEITFPKDMTFGGKPVKAGKYRMYAVPGATSWKLVLNDTFSWGASEPDHAHDVLTVESPVEHPAGQQLEQFTITVDDTGIDYAWDTTKVRVPLGA